MAKRQPRELILKKIYNIIVLSDGISAQTIALRLQRHISTVRSYLYELKREGKIRINRHHYYPVTQKVQGVISDFSSNNTVYYQKPRKTKVYTVVSPVNKLQPIPIVDGKPDLSKFKMPRY